MADLRFCAYQYQHLPLDGPRVRWRLNGGQDIRGRRLSGHQAVLRYLEP